jgi:Uma2 family endonuclease
VNTPPTYPPSPLLAVAGFLRQFTVCEYHDLLRVGILWEGEPVELLEGFMVNKMQNVTAQPPSLLSLAGFRKITVAEYHKMLDTGILIEGEPIELLEGYLVNKIPRNPPHDVTLQRLDKRLHRLGLSGWEIRIQLAVTFTESEPEPDGAIVRGNDDTFARRHPSGGDFGIIIEVSDANLVFDRREKGRIYARAGVPVYWVINVTDRQVEVYTDPDTTADPPVYRTRTDYQPGDQLPVNLDGVQLGTIFVGDLLA